MAGSFTEEDVSLFISCIGAAARAPVPGLAKPVAVRLDLGAAGTYTLRAAPNTEGSLEKDDSTNSVLTTPDCTLACTLPVLLDIANGRRKPAVAYMQGHIKVQGDRGAFTNVAGVLKDAAASFKSQREARAAANAATRPRVTVHGASVVADARDKYAVYLVEIFESDSRWTVTRRWSEVRSLQKRISTARIPQLRRGSSILPRSLDFAASFEPSFLASRAKVIETYLNEVLAAVPVSLQTDGGGSAASQALRAFLVPRAFSGPRTAGIPHMSRGSAGQSALGTPRDTEVSDFEPAGSCGIHFSPAFSSPMRSSFSSPGGASAWSYHTTRAAADPSFDSRTETPAGVATHGLLIHSLLNSAATTPIAADRDDALLSVRRGVLAEFRTLCQQRDSTSSSWLLSLVATAAVLVWRCLLPVALAVAAAERGYAVTTILLAARATSGAIACEPRHRAWLVLGVSVLAHTYGQMQLAKGESEPSCADGEAGEAEAAHHARFNMSAAVSAAVDSAVRAAIVATTTWPPSTEAQAEGAQARAMNVSATGYVSGLERVQATCSSSPRRTMAVLTALTVLTLCVLFFGRLLRVYGVALSVIFGYYFFGRVLTFLAQRSTYVAQREDAIYAFVHRQVSPKVCMQLVELRSVFVKFGQYIGGRADIVPPEWAASLKMLQDDLPPCSASYLRRTLQDEFRRPASESFAELEPLPIASASVAQVHLAQLHPRHAAQVGGGFATGAPGGAGDGDSPEGEKVVLKLQHQGVAKQMRIDMVACLRIARLMRWLNPQFEAFYTVMAAWEEEMFKELDFRHEADNLVQVAANLRRAGIDAIVPVPVQGLVGERAFAMSFEEGFKITDEENLAMHSVDREALMVRIVQIYAQQMFVDGFFNADPHAGNLFVQIKDGRATPVLLDFGMTVRLTDEQRLGYAQLAYAAQQLDMSGLQEAMTTLGVLNNKMDSDPSRDLHFWRYFLRDTGPRSTSQAESKAFFAQRIKEAEQDKAAGRPTRQLESIPSSLIFFWRVIGLIRGLCSQLRVKVPYMDLLAARARIALAMRIPAPQRALTMAPMIELPSGEPFLQRRMSMLLARLCEEGSIAAGVQVCVQRHSVTLVDCCAGFRGLVDPRGMTPEVPMPLLDMSTLLPVVALHTIIHAGDASYSTRLDPSWPGCREAALAGYTIGEALSHMIPIDGTQMWRQGAKALASLPGQLQMLSKTPLRPADSLPRSSGSAQGTLLAGIIEGVCNASYASELSRRLLEPMGLADLVHAAGMHPQAQAEAATASTGFAAQLQRFASLGAAGGDGMSNGASAMAGGEGVGTAPTGDSGAGDSGAGGGGGGGGAVGPAERFGHELPLNAGMVNNTQVRSGCVPGLGAFATARGLTALLDAASRGGMGPVAGIGVESGTEQSTLFGERTWTRGLQKYECSGGTEPYVLGLHSFGGSLALFFPSSGISACILLNDCQLDYAPTRQVLEVLTEELKTGHVEFMANSLF